MLSQCYVGGGEVRRQYLEASFYVLQPTYNAADDD